MKEGNNIILTGPPRSGTTLTCHLLNKVDNFIALHEPMNLKMFPDRETAVQNIHSFFGEMRESLLTEGKALAKVKQGKIPDNPFDNNTEGTRMSNVQKGLVHFDKPLTQDFKLGIKQNAHFTFLLKELLEQYPCYTVIRNPLSTIASWNSISAPVSKGNLTVLKGIDPTLYEILDNIPHLIDRQVRLIHEIYKPYRLLSTESIITYEDIIRSNGKILSAISPEAENLQESLESRNQNKVYDKALMEKIAAKLIADKEAAWRDHYTEWNIEYSLSQMV